MADNPNESISFINHKNKSISEIGFYLFYAFSISWLCWITIIIANRYFNTLYYNEGLFWIPYSIASLGPAISAYLVFRKYNTGAPHKSFTKFIFGQPMSWKIGFIFIAFFSWRLWMIWFSYGIDEMTSVLTIIVNLPFLIVLGGLEELGWRGILQPKLEGLISYLPSIFLVSMIWSVWHIPLWFIKGSVQSGFPFWMYYVVGLVLTASFTTLHKYTHNLFLCVINLAWFNGCIGLALYVGNNGVIQIKTNGTIVSLLVFEFVMAILLGFIYPNHRLKS